MEPDIALIGTLSAENRHQLQLAMDVGKPVRDSCVDSNGQLKPAKDVSFLERERKYLDANGWKYDPASQCWIPSDLQQMIHPQAAADGAESYGGMEEFTELGGVQMMGGYVKATPN